MKRKMSPKLADRDRRSPAKASEIVQSKTFENSTMISADLNRRQASLIDNFIADKNQLA